MEDEKTLMCGLRMRGVVPSEQVDGLIKISLGGCNRGSTLIMPSPGCYRRRMTCGNGAGRGGGSRSDKVEEQTTGEYIQFTIYTVFMMYQMNAFYVDVLEATLEHLHSGDQLCVFFNAFVCGCLFVCVCT